MDALFEMLLFGVFVMPTVLLALWPRGRRFAALPLALSLVAIGALFSYGAGHYLREISVNPHKFRCGNAFELPVLGLLGLAGWTAAVGVALMIPAGPRPVGRSLLTWVLPLFLLTCTLGGLAGRYAGM